MQWTKVLGLGLGAAALLGLGIILGHFAIPKKANSPAPSISAPQDLDLEILETVMGQLDAHRIRENLRELSREPHLASSPRDEDLVQLLLQRWKDPESGLDSAEAFTYEVLLSFPSQEQPNVVDIVGPTGDIIHSCHRTEENVTGEQGGPDVIQPYAAYAPSGNPQGLLVYANHGTEDDFKELQTQGIKLEGTIALTRYGGVGRGDKPIGFQDARDLLCNLNGTSAPTTWQGALGCHYRLGPGFRPDGNFSADSQVNVSVYNRLELRNSSNVLGIIRGAVEPDRYVLYGNHRDSWVHGAVDPSSGTAVLLELSRVLGTLLKKGTWRPRRSIVFASWGAEEFGLIGSTEFTEEFFNKLQERTVAYINVDIAVFANATLRVQGTPPVQSVVFSATKEIRSPGPGDLSIYDNWIRYFNRSSPVYGLVPSLGSLGAGSDYAPFIHFLGISSMDIAYTYDRSKTSARIYPTYHTAFDTFDYVDKFLDPGFSSHQAVARTAGSIILRLSDSFFLPLKVSDYSETLRSFLQAAQQDLGALLEQHSISLGPLVTAVEKFEAEAAALGQRISMLQKGSPDPLQVRMLNDQLMLLERSFLNPRAFPEERYYSHVLWAARTGSVATFPGLSNACSRANDTASGSEAWAEVQRQLSIVVTALEGAAATLRPVADL
ncbi:PREDICTED: N-acetylated-alpha-linked acidic dipeptidase-like protein isoform X3 [Rhinopithecus bieti]|uniref:N-acetylated-alpha-linked acidic dipeptidase-like protein isoform X3 n=1 Tax=Rhinopithecus bieti TaxID=61621 RepID=UPI00083C5F95|nr:PREDICTED: N-acetylated-alpha-linked acidic dipeptidase-like protein isoform X3 [Rhinopithecus bieti]